MADLLSLGGSAASVAVNPESPTAWASLAQSVGKALGLFGGGGTPSILQGVRVTGTLAANGLSGERTTAFDQLGNTWDATGGDANFFSSLGADIWGSNDNKTRVSTAFGSNTMPFSITLPGNAATPNDYVLPIRTKILAAINSMVPSMADQSTDIAAPAIPATSAPAGTVDATGAGLLVGGGTGSGGSSSVAPAPAAPIANASNGPAWIWVALAIGAYYVSKH